MVEHFTVRQLNWRHPGAACDRWAIDGPASPGDSSGPAFCGNFPDEATAREVAKRWNETGGEAVKIGWTSATTDSDHDRGTYRITMDGTRWSRCTGGWHGMEEAASIAAAVRDQIAKHGLLAVRETIASIG